METVKSQGYIENEKLFVDIHKPESMGTLHKHTAGNDISEDRTGYDDSDYLESALNRPCDSCREERPLLESNTPNTISDCKHCISCGNRTQSDDSTKWKPSHLVKSVFQDSLRSLLDNVGNESAVSSKNSAKKLCVSLTNLNDSKGLESTSL
jgi:succinate dehydrogenase/fumarate reductase-like Fe-S protein